ncbi:MAG: SMC family ATPase, partial [Schwartzia sp.]|nr:SMC family ATPase [Schwartzia sp. (in: firmicutes)]
GIEQTAKEKQEEQNEIFTKVSERVQNALKVFGNIKKADDEVKKKQIDVAEAQERVKTAKGNLEHFEKEEQAHRKTAETIGDVDSQVNLLQGKLTEADRIAEDIAAMETAQKELHHQNENWRKAQKQYTILNKKWQAKDQEHREKNTALQNARAGILAREELHPGKPCPVCGSLDHPSPCKLSGEAQGLTQEIIDALADEEKTLREQQQDAAIASESAKKLAEEKQKNVQALGEQLRKRMEQSIPDVPAEMKLPQAQKALSDWRETLQIEMNALKKNKSELKKAQAFLKSADSKKQKLQDEREKAAAQETKAKEALAAAIATRENLEEQKIFAGEAEAKQALAKEEQAKKNADDAFKKARNEAQAARTAKENAEALIGNYQKVLPGQRQEKEKRRADYTRIMEEKDRAESEWQDVVAKYEKKEVESLQERIDAHNRKKAGAEGAKRNAEEAISNRPMPDMEKLKKAMEETEEILKAATGNKERIQGTLRTDQAVYDALSPKMGERHETMQNYETVNSLYRRLSGNIKGAHMDIETFVQRYYLKKILHAANTRFRDMSAGQFELRISSEEQAGTGKNHGLDLMVYSNVTGKEREIRTLSGGESFMAALAMALGMADQIQQGTAAVNLDVMFIDEGFGSLDDHSRAQAVKVLQRVADGSKLIGIISHVAELKQSIEDQLMVTKDRDGSHARWQS